MRAERAVKKYEECLFAFVEVNAVNDAVHELEQALLMNSVKNLVACKLHFV